MAIIPGNQICIPPGEGAAASIIKAMERILMLRKNGRLTRRQFIFRWDKMRKALFLTPEYQAFRNVVLKRDGGICKMCNKRTAEHVHHIIQVSYEPRRALDMLNGQAACIGCHSSHHKPRSITRNPTEVTSGLALPATTQNHPSLEARSARNHPTATARVAS